MPHFKYRDEPERTTQGEMNAVSEHFVGDDDQCDDSHGDQQKPMPFDKIKHTLEQHFHGYL